MIETPFPILPEILAFAGRAEAKAQAAFSAIDTLEQYNGMKVLKAFLDHGVSTAHLSGSTGYGYGDIGRETLDAVFASAFGAEDALVRHSFVSGTHALTVGLFGLLRPGQNMLAAAGRPYDTLESVIGIEKKVDGSLADWGVGYGEVELNADGTPNLPAIEAAVNEKTGLVLVQRSRGYAWRPALTLEQIGAISEVVHRKNPRAVVMVDNCYGEFTDTREPVSVGADIMAGSLIKNIGGGLAPTGGYVAGREECVARVADRVGCPGIGAEAGSYAASYRPFYQGLYMAPHTVMQAIRGAALCARAYELAGYETSPAFDAHRTDIIQAIKLHSPEKMVAFCQALQAVSPIDSFARPEPDDMPGYADQVIMAAGTFVSGASIELSADGPIREPYTIYWQGGLVYEQCRLAVKKTLEAVGVHGE